MPGGNEGFVSLWVDVLMAGGDVAAQYLLVLHFHRLACPVHSE